MKMNIFQGFRRPDGKAGVRNHLLVIPSVGCSQNAAQAIARSVKGAVCLPNVLGCGQVGEDRLLVKKTLVGFGIHPNVFGVLVVGNGCEHLNCRELAQGIAPAGKRVEAIEIQEAGGSSKTIALGKKILRGMREGASALHREPIPISDLIVGTECGGSDSTSGLASNPAVGMACDRFVSAGGTVILSETPELIGAEHLIAARGRTPEISRQVLDAVSWWENRAIAAGQDIRESNPAPGNIAGGITTLEEKSLGCIYKAGTTPLEEVVPYASQPTRKGLIFMDTPAHDIEQLTGMVAGGAQIVLFTTGRGTPLGSPIAPVVKITANRERYLRMRDNMDIDVSGILRGRETVRQAGHRIFEKAVSFASGKLTKAERLGQRDFCIFTENINI
jgi:altronate dehydratase large subunit